jgi:hypothetical protein
MWEVDTNGNRLAIIIFPLVIINPLKASGYYIVEHAFNILILCTLPTKGICVFHIILTTNSDCFPKQR